jgi:hypothetical protein
VYKLVHPIIAARKQSRRTTTYGGSTGIRSYVDSLLDLQIPDISENNGDTTTTGTKRRPLTDKEMVKLVFEFLGTNTESVVSCVEWTLAHLVIDPEVQKKLHREITGIQQDYNGIVVSEERLHRLPYLRGAGRDAGEPPATSTGAHYGARCQCQGRGDCWNTGGTRRRHASGRHNGHTQDREEQQGVDRP